ncbi:hypothetical protein AB4562_03515 [Vibrio sp. 10N.222.54.A1]|jgi:hypothetical protein|uniref:Uncharacterized protein n=2 Tax=Vibrio cyclitrophicus TaxID=47951 RepID=A0A7Z1MJ59_9VIBR|nr:MULTISPECIES: hypothetical protein [Vibrio]PMK82329.1 hypothetical protein BCT92_13980 [Vibrio sp. 10N.261.52.E5]PMP25338.1 hypothetical protein BCS91_00280 [Vibrio cyclitrophicus]PMP29734.1 hypothetical protein BCS90_16430 [Vibrio cyclitrophicus]TKF84945.1 hypothetical protein FCV65_04425 [Vibrio sp. F13]
MTQLFGNTTNTPLRQQLKMMRQSEGAVNTPTLSSRRLAMTQRLNHLKMFSRGQSPEQLGDVDDLKGLNVREAIKVQGKESESFLTLNYCGLTHVKINV